MTYVKEQIINRIRILSNHIISRLSLREMECIEFLLQRFSNKVIAAELNVSPRTVEDHIDNIKLKLCCKTKTKLVIVLTKYYCQI